MAQNFIHEGWVIEVPAPVAVTSGDGVMIGTKFGVALGTAAQGALVRVQLYGVWKLKKAITSGSGLAVGAGAYWDNTAKKVTNVTTGGNTLIGIALTVTIDGDTEGVYRLNP